VEDHLGRDPEPWLARYTQVGAAAAIRSARRRQVLDGSHDSADVQVLDRRTLAGRRRLGYSTRRSRTSGAVRHGGLPPKFNWAPFLADIALFANGIIRTSSPASARPRSTSTRSDRPVHVGQARRRPSVTSSAIELLAARQAVSRPVTWTSSPTENSVSCSAAAARSRSTSFRPSTRSRTAEHAGRHDGLSPRRARTTSTSTRSTRRSRTCMCDVRFVRRSTRRRS